MTGDMGPFMRRAIALGRRGWGRVHPNPMVGCVLVRGGRIVGEGWHREYGGPHAEVMALEEAGERAQGAEAHVSLEPCRHEGKTAPCTRALVEAGVARVIFGARDPGEVSGGGAGELAASGIEVAGPVLNDRQAKRENPGFFHAAEDRPWILLKLAVSLDACLATAEGERTVLSGPEATREVHRLRAGFDAILVGTRTALVDDPRLTVRGPITPRVPPLRVVLDANGRISPSARIFTEDGGAVWVVTTAASESGWRADVEGTGGRVLEVGPGSDGGVALPAALAALRSEGVGTLLCEGGGILGSALIRGGFVDRLVLVVAPRLLGETGVPAFPGSWTGSENGGAVDPARWVPVRAPRRLGSDIWMEFEPNVASEEGSD